ncbi:hypothetical protein N431DRAFT_338719 [Stipitochalara longipes BDJ]|nr:hypothetical protein N431DRAFT_338719 [Stipitochalara longipes BDJ]
MSKITPKNLHYDDTLPPFLARLRANNASQDGRHEYHVARPKKARNADEEAEDEPVYFDEGTGETLTKTEWEAKDAALEAEVGHGGVNDGAECAEGTDPKENKEKLAAIGSSKKRKTGKVVGGDDEEVATESGKKPISPSKIGKKVQKGRSAKGKKIKLSFGDDE